jgi:hypothetical protein
MSVGFGGEKDPHVQEWLHSILWGICMKTLRNALFVDLTDSIVEKIVVMTKTATEEMVSLKWWFGTFLSLRIWSVGLQIKRSQNYYDDTKRSISRMPDW